MQTKSMKDAELFVIGASAGGIDVLNKLLPAFKKNSRYIVAVVIHLPPDGPNLLTSLFSPICELAVTEATSGEDLRPDTIYFCPSDYHLCIEPNHTLSLSSEDPLNFSRPSIDILFESAAYAFRKKAVGILLTGANNDGAAGLKKVQEQGGVTIVQEPRNAEYDTMPLSAMEMMKPDYVLTEAEIIELIDKVSTGGVANGRI